MIDDYGVRMNSAVRAVAQMHSDTSKLLIDCDKHIGKGRPSIFGSYATKDLTYNYRAEQWMAEGVFRYYAAGRNSLEGVTVSFQEEETEQPMFLIAQICYKPNPDVPPSHDDAAAVKDRCKEWDIWSLYFYWGEKRQDTVLEYKDPDDGRIESARLMAVPLYSVKSIEDVEGLYEQVRAYPQTASAVAG